MALLSKTLVAHNLHNFTLELQKAFEEGWRVHKDGVARRSLGNRFSVALSKGEAVAEPVVGKVESQPELDENKVVVQDEQPVATETKADEAETKADVVADEKPAAPKTTRGKSKAKTQEGEAE